MKITIFQLSYRSNAEWKSFHFRINKGGTYSSGIRRDGTVNQGIGSNPSFYTEDEIQFTYTLGDIDD